MSARDVAVRPPPLPPELGPSEPVQLGAVPTAPESERGWLAAVLPGLSVLGIAGFALLSPNALIIAASVGVAVVAAAVGCWATRRQRRARDAAWIGRRDRYLGHLASRRKTLVAASARQRAHGCAVHPSPISAIAAARQGEVWERRPEQPEFLRVRLGVGRVAAHRPPRDQASVSDGEGDPALLSEVADVIARFSGVDGLPLVLDISPSSAANVAVFAGCDRALLRAFVVALARAHGPDVVRLHALASTSESRWLRLLPHAGCVSGDLAELLRVVRAQLRDSDPAHHVVIAGVGATPSDDQVAALAALAARAGRGSTPSVSVIIASPTAPSVPAEPVLITADSRDNGLTIATPGRLPQRTNVAVADAVSFAGALQFAEYVSRCTLACAAGNKAASQLRLSSLLSPTLDPLVLPLGRDDDGATVSIDLREAARGGDGPHGLVIGATGSGKSELLRTILVAAASQSHPDQLAFLLIDFKGGAAFSELARLPHTAGLLTNLGARPHEVDRLCASLRAELHRRQRALRAAGVDDVDAYRAQLASAGAEQLPRLLVVVDEYAELIEQSPDMLDVLTSFGRLGRSLGIHLVLSSQRVDDGRLRGLDAHLRFRICLRTFAAAESLAAIGSPLAAQLPPTPGLAWLRQDDRLTRLHTALVGDPAAAVGSVVNKLVGGPERTPSPPQQTRSICPPPLPDALSLASPEAVSRGCTGSKAVVGLIDVPESGLQRPLVLDLTGAAGHLAVVGAPRSGRSTALATAVAAVACATAASELAVHVVTSAGSVLAGVAGLPHVGTVATTGELAERVIRAVADTVAERRTSPPQRTSRVVLVVDDLATLLADDDIAMQLATVASQGLAVHVSLAVSCSRWSELRSGMREAIGSRWELRLNDPSESLQPSLARRLPERPPGRILNEEGRWAQLALPRADGRDSAEGLPQALADLVAAVARRGGPATRPVQLLPRRVPAHSLPRPSQPGGVPIGVHGPYAEPVEVSLRPGEHLVVLGNSGSGRSGFLRAVADAARWWQPRLWTVDPRGTLHADTRRAARTAAQVAALTEELVGNFRGAPSAGDEQAWQLLIVDDLDLLTARSAGLAPLSPLLEVLPYAADIGLSVVASRRLSGFTKAAFDPFFGQLLDLCETAIVLSGDPSEGAVVGGIRPHPQPPGRGHLVQRGQQIGQVQLAWRDPAEGRAAAIAEPGASATKPRRDGA